MSERLRFQIVAPERVVVASDADAVTVPGALGALGILPGHAALVAGLRIGEVRWRLGGREHAAVVTGGFVEVAENAVTVLADGAELPAEIDLEAAHGAFAEAQEHLRSAGGDEADAWLATLALATTRIAVASRN